jgi:GT2 family glycosyltransferase
MIDVILPVWATDEETMRLTEASITLLRKTPNLRLIIIDNASTIGGGQMREWADIYIRNKINLGYAKAMNQGFRIAETGLVVVVENDVFVGENWLPVAEEILKDPKVGSCHFRMIEYGQPHVNGDKTFLKGRERWISAPFYVIKKKAIPEGGYDEGYGLGGYEDWDIFHRMRHLNGWINAYTTKSCFQHLHSYTQNKLDQTERAKGDIERRNYFKSKFGEYPEDIWNKKYPEQMAMNYFAVLQEL